MNIIPSAASAAALLLTLSGPACAAAAEIVGAPSADPIEREGIMHSAHAFYIINDRQASVIRFHRTGRNVVCNRVDYRSVNRTTPVPLNVEWIGRSTIVMPGRCLRIDAASVLVAPAAPMPSDTILRGT
jgi:hypothetical protein